MAAFNPKPWFKQPVGTKLSIQNKSMEPYAQIDDDFVSDIPKAFIIEDENSDYYENISYSYEIFNDLIVWGLVNFPKLVKFFMKEMEIRGPKISFDRDQFKPLTKKTEFMLIGDIDIGSKEYKKLSISQKYICKLLSTNV